MQIEGSAESISRLLAEHENLRRRILELEAAQRSWQAERTPCKDEKTLRESNQVLTVILENTHMRVAYLDAGFNFIWVNRAFADAGGQEPAFFHGKNYFELYPDTEKQAVFQTVVATGKSYMAAATPFVQPSQAGSGLTYWDVGLIPIKDKAGRTTSLVFTLVEATERVKAAESLRDSEARFRTAFENAAVGMALIDLDGRAIGANTALAQMLGYQKRELIGKTVREVMHPDDYDDHLRLFRDLLEARTQYGDSERRLRCKDGAIIHTQVWSTIHRDETGAPLQLVSIVRDVTEQIRTQKEKARLESQLRQAQKMEAIGTLAGGIAHDFNNILSIIIGNAELLESETALRGSAGDELNQIRIAAQRAKHLVRQILAFSRQEGQRKESLNLKPVLKETIDFLRASLPATIQLECNIGQNVGFIMGDPTQVQQVLMNLCTNASHAMEKDGGRLSLDVEQVVIEGDHVSHDQSLTPGEYVRLTIADTGHGMEPWILPRIFDPYFTTKGPDKGTGLGL